MWAFLEQKSFPLDEASYRAHIGEVIEVVNRLGLSDEVRAWLATETQKPKIGKALAFPLVTDERLKEFVV